MRQTEELFRTMNGKVGHFSDRLANILALSEELRALEGHPSVTHHASTDAAPQDAPKEGQYAELIERAHRQGLQVNLLLPEAPVGSAR